MSLIHPILFVDLLKQSSYKNAILFSMMHKQMTYFSKKCSKSNRITLNIQPDYIGMDEIIKCDKDYHPYRYDPTKNVNKNLYKLFALCKKDNIKAIKCVKNNPRIPTYGQRGGYGFFGFDGIMFHCAACSDIRIVRWFLNNGYCLTHGAMMHFYQTTSGGIYCRYFRTPKIVKLLLDKNVIYNNMQDDHNAKHNTNKKFLLVHRDVALVSSTSNIMIVKILLDHGARDDYALHVCVYNEHIDVLKLLLDHGANIHHDDDKAFVTAASKGNLEIMTFLISKGANIHADNDRALVYSALNGHKDVVKYLLDNNTNIHSHNNYALRWSIWNDHHKVVKLLLEKGANIHDAINNNSLDRCNREGFIKTAKILLDYGADITTITGVIHPDIEKYAKEKLNIINYPQ